MNTKLKRHPSLKPLARDHGLGLVCAQRMQKASNATSFDRVLLTTQIMGACASIMRRYLEDEERILRQFIHEDALWNELTTRHLKLSTQIARLEAIEPANDPGANRMRNISRTLINDYVRWEERTLFPTLEARLSESDLASLGELTNEVESKRFRPTQVSHASVTLHKHAGTADTCGCWMNNFQEAHSDHKTT
ncbi:MAG: hypothetical protein ACRDHZ_20480 [Ktedonobacteraceae bacterium]